MKQPNRKDHSPTPVGRDVNCSTIVAYHSTVPAYYLNRTLVAVAAVTLCSMPLSQAKRSERPELPRFRTRVQTLSGVMPTLLTDVEGGQRITAFVPLDLELATRLDGPLSLVAAGVAYLAPFSMTPCSEHKPLRAHALASLMGVRLDFNNSRDGSWWSPWVALRMGVIGQEGNDDLCQPRLRVAPAFSPRLGADLWMGTAAASFAVGYDYLPTGSALSLQAGLTVRLH